MMQQRCLSVVTDPIGLQTLENAPQMVARVANDGTVLDGNRMWRSFVEANTFAPARGESYLKLLSTQEVSLELRRLEPRLQRVFRGEEEGASFLLKVALAEGPRWFEAWAESVTDGEEGAALIFHGDVTEIRRLKQELQRLRSKDFVTLESVTDAVLRTDPTGRIEDMNRVAERLTGWKVEEACGRLLQEVCRFVPEDRGSNSPRSGDVFSGPSWTTGGQLSLEHRNGRVYRVQLHTARIANQEGRLQGFVFTIANMTQSWHIASELERRARLDCLTELINRREFRAQLDNELAELQRSANGAGHALCFLDLDQFKVINDTCGHIAGDELLRQVARILVQQVRASDLVGRLGGDEFALLLKDCQLEQAERIASKIRRAIGGFRFSWQDKFFRIGVSIGVVEIKAGDDDLNDLLSLADAACFAAKHQGRNRVHVHQKEDTDAAQLRRNMHWVTRIESGLEDGHFRVYAQLIQPSRSSAFDDDRQILELLVRLESPTDGLISPGAFLPAAERYGMIQRIDEWMFKEMSNILVRHPDLIDRFQLFSLNFSGLSICDEEFVTRIALQLQTLEVPPEKWCFEITETAIISNLPQACRSVDRLRQHGCRFALDDFGSGACSFSHLRALEVDLVKIDGSFVRRLLDCEIDRTIVQSINEVAHAMGMKTVAEYVESEDLMQRVEDIGVDFLQGHALGKAQPIQTFL